MSQDHEGAPGPTARAHRVAPGRPTRQANRWPAGLGEAFPEPVPQRHEALWRAVDGGLRPTCAAYLFAQPGHPRWHRRDVHLVIRLRGRGGPSSRSRSWQDAIGDVGCLRRLNGWRSRSPTDRGEPSGVGSVLCGDLVSGHPGHGVDGFAVVGVDLEVEVRPRRVAAVAGLSDDLTRLDALAFGY